MLREFKLPDAGEGLTEAEIVKWHVSAGDKVTVNQTIVEIETAKAVVELPCPFEGVVSSLMAAEGDTVAVGKPIIVVETGEGGPTAPAAAAPPVPEAKPERRPVLVGYGVKLGATTRRPRKSTTATPATASTPTVTPAPPPVPAVTPAPTPAPVSAVRAGASVLAKPPVRKLAKDLGVDLTGLTGTGPNGSITRDDVHAAVGAVAEPEVAPAVRYATLTGAEREERLPVKGVRKAMAAAMVSSAFTAPHVTEFLQVDVTATMDAVRRLRELPDFAEVKVSPLLLVAKALLTAVRRYPLINSTWTGDEIVVKRYVNLGIAAATQRGLIVPNVKEAQALTLPDLAKALAELTEQARSGRSRPADLTGGTITITNVGVFGVDGGTPILNAGEAAILAFGQIRDLPWVVDGQIVARKVTTLSLSFDHRIVDGELGSYVLRDVGGMLQDPLRMLAWS